MEKPNLIRFQYLGCSAFVISDGEGTSVALDLWTKGVFPYAEDTPDELGLGEPPVLSALLVSHDHQDHCFIPPGVPVIHGVRSRKVDDSPDLGRVGNFAIGKFSSQHFGSDAKRPKLNAVFVLAVAGVKVVHLGDAHGTMADAAQLRELKQKIGEVDLLMIPIGSPWLKPVDKAILDMTIGILDPRVSIPMHYWTLAGKAVVLSGLSELGYQLVEMHGNNVLMTDHGPFIIDWMNGRRGHPLGDVARTALVLQTGGLPPRVSSPMRLLINISRLLIHSIYLNRYLQLHPASRSEIIFWQLPLLAARLFEVENYPGEKKLILSRIRKALARMEK